MASISRALQRIKQDLAELIPKGALQRICREVGHAYRRRKLGPLETVHLFVQQVLHYNTALTHLPRLSGMEFDPSAYCVARQRLPLKVVRALLKLVSEAAGEELRTTALWEGHRLVLVDGSGCSMPDTPVLQKQYGQPGGQKPGCGFPVAKLLGLFDASSGMILDLLDEPLRTHEMSKISSLLPLLMRGDVLVGDRGFCSYPHLALLLERGAQGVFRLHQRYIIEFRPKSRARSMRREQRRRRRAKGRTASRFLRWLGECDQVVQWYKPTQRPTVVA